MTDGAGSPCPGTNDSHTFLPRGLERGHRLWDTRRHQDHPVLAQELLRSSVRTQSALRE